MLSITSHSVLCVKLLLAAFCSVWKKASSNNFKAIFACLSSRVQLWENSIEKAAAEGIILSVTNLVEKNEREYRWEHRVERLVKMGYSWTLYV